MTENVTVKSYVVDQTQKNVGSDKKEEAVVLSKDSFKIIAKISSSRKLSETEKSGLLSHVALVEKYAKGNLRSRMLNNITATTLFLERSSSNVAAKPNINKAIQQVKQRMQVSPPVEVEPAKAQKQVEQVVKAVENLPKQFKTSLSNVKEVIPQSEIKAVLNKTIAEVAQAENVQVQEIKQLGAGSPAVEQFNIQDNIQISDSAKTAQEVTLPGSNSADAEFAVLGSGTFEEIPLPGAADINRDIAARIAVLEKRGVPELPLPGGINVENIAAQILATPKQAIESIGELILPGGENGSVNEQAVQVALSV